VLKIELTQAMFSGPERKSVAELNNCKRGTGECNLNMDSSIYDSSGFNNEMLTLLASPFLWDALHLQQRKPLSHIFVDNDSTLHMSNSDNYLVIIKVLTLTLPPSCQVREEYL
jgi:hypothetical protein